MPCSRAVVEHVLGGAVGEVVEVLHATRSSAIVLRLLELLDADLGQADVPDLALVLQLRRARRPGRPAGTVGVDAVQLEQVDPLDAEAAQAQLDLLAQVLRAARPESTRPGPARVRPALVAITRSSAYGCSASRSRSSATYGP